jgi:hypothetical protein
MGYVPYVVFPTYHYATVITHFNSIVGVDHLFFFFFFFVIEEDIW